MAQETPGAQKVQSPSSVRGRAGRQTSKGASAKGSPPNPTRTIEPGKEHYAISAFLLRLLQRSAAAQGIELDIGTIPTYTGVDATEDDPARPARLVAHAVARASDRVPVLRKFSRHIEGNERKAGLGSDLIATAWEIYTRNQDQIENLARQYTQQARTRRSAAPVKPTTGGVPQ